MKLDYKSRLALASALILVTSLIASAQNKMDNGEMRSYEITVTNLTPNDTMEHGQPFSPALFVTHNALATPLFKMGQPASFGLQRMAEEGNPGPFLSAVIVPMLNKQYGHATTQISILPGETRTTYVTTGEHFPLLSAVWMLVKTNDGFTGVDSINLWSIDDDKPMTMELAGYDAGTERNNERAPNLVAKMGAGRDPENGRIAMHTGIKGNADAPPDWKFNPSSVARITIKRVKLDKETMMMKNGGMIQNNR